LSESYNKENKPLWKISIRISVTSFKLITFCPQHYPASNTKAFVFLT